jgi:hypothetical protein
MGVTSEQKMREAINLVLDNVGNDCGPDYGGWRSRELQSACDLLEALSKREAQEPFGYVDCHPDHGYEFSKNKQVLYPADTAAGWSQVAVYTSPQSREVPAEWRKALSDLESMAERYRQLGAPMPDAQKAARALLASKGGAE